MTANPTHAELVEVLRAGVRHAGEAATDDGLIELFDIEGADEIMNEAADALEEADTLRAENARLREALTNLEAAVRILPAHLDQPGSPLFLARAALGGEHG